VCITTYEPLTKSIPNTIGLILTLTRQHAVVNIQLINYSHVSYIEINSY